jgi:hypothetical protein
MTLIPDLQRDLVDAAGRLGRRPRLPVPAGPAITAALATALLVAAVVLEANDGGESDSRPTDSILPAAEPANPPMDEPLTAPPRPRLEPLPGSTSPPLEFEFDGVSYSAVGFRSEGSVICMTLKRSTADEGPAPPAGGSCLRDRLLTDALATTPVHMFAGGGRRPFATAGFARADVAELTLVGPTDAGDEVFLSEPWKPEPSEGEPIRFVYVLSESGPETIPSFDRHRFRAELTNGEVVPAP